MASGTKRAARTELKSTSYEIFIGALSILSIANLVLVFVLADHSATQHVLVIMNGLLSVIFLADFLYRFFTAESKTAYFFRHFGWADLIASLPFPHMKILRVFRVVRVIRLMHGVGTRRLLRTLLRDRAGSALMTLLLMGILVLEFGSLLILRFEEYADGSNITTASDAVWYTIVTISTVGYGDQYPVTPSGRFMGAIIIVVGVGIFGTFTGFLANAFLGTGADDDSPTGTTEQTSVEPDAARDTAPGVAGGGASGAVAAGVAAHREETLDDDRSDRLEELAAQAEATLAEIREILSRR